MESILVTGGAGMIGSNLVKRLVHDGYHAIVIDNLWRGKLEYLNNNHGEPVINLEKDFFNRDLAIPDSCDDIIQNIDYIIHLADIVAGIKFVFNNQGFVFRKNILINSNIISSAKKHSVKGFMYIGTACSFPAELQSGVEARPLRETDQYPASPESAYGWSKLMGEYETLLMGEEIGIPVSVISLHNVYGSPCDYGKESGQVIPSLIYKAIIAHEEPLIVWGSGEQGRAFLHVHDAVEALILALQKGFGHKLIQIGPDVCTPIKEIAEMVVEISGKNIQILYDTTKPEGDKGRSADFSKAKEILGWEPRVRLYDGIKRLFEWIDTRIEEER